MCNSLILNEYPQHTESYYVYMTLSLFLFYLYLSVYICICSWLLPLLLGVGWWLNAFHSSFKIHTFGTPGIQPESDVNQKQHEHHTNVIRKRCERNWFAVC